MRSYVRSPVHAAVVAAFGFLAAASPADAAPKAANEPSQEELAAAAEQKRGAVQQLLKIIHGEPTVKEVQRWALEFYRLEPERINSMATAARLKGLVPELEGSVDNLLGHTFNNTKNAMYGTAFVNDGNPSGFLDRASGSSDQLTWRVRAAWNLDRLVFNSEALDVKSLNSLQENLVREVTALYFGRRRLIAGLLLTPPQEDQELFYELTRLDEMTATIDALTGDRFGGKAWKWDQQDGGAAEEPAQPPEEPAEKPAPAKPQK